MDDGEYQLIAGVDDATAGEALAFPNLYTTRKRITNGGKRMQLL